jgi:hypothetical protein
MFVGDTSMDFVDLATKNFITEPRDHIRDMLEKYQIRLRKGLDSEAAVEVLFQIGIFMDQTEGSRGALRARQMYHVEKLPDTKHTQDLIAANITAAFYANLMYKRFLTLNKPEDLDELATETVLFFEKCANDPDPERKKIFQRLIEQPEVYPRMCVDPLFRALSQEEWQPESMRNDKSIPDEVYNDDEALFVHWMWSFLYIAGSGAWADRRLAEFSGLLMQC